LVAVENCSGIANMCLSKMLRFVNGLLLGWGRLFGKRDETLLLCTATGQILCHFV
jgi:hypothetical protein